MSRLRSVLALVAALLLYVPFALVPTPFSLPIPLWPVGLAGLGLAVALLVTTAPDPDRVRAPTARTAVLRSLAGALVLGVGTWFHTLAGGGAFFLRTAL